MGGEICGVGEIVLTTEYEGSSEDWCLLNWSFSGLAVFYEFW
jgi:hypothetical protein